MIPFRPVLALSLAAALVLSACGGSDDKGADDGVAVTPTINVGTTTDPVSQLLAEIYGQGLENAGYRVGRKDPVADEKTAITNMQADTVQLLPEFTSSLLAYLTDNGFEPTATTTTTVDAATDVPSSEATSSDPTTDVTTDIVTTSTGDVSSTDPDSTDPDSTDPSATDVTATDGSAPDDTTLDAADDPNSAAYQIVAIRSRLPATLVVTETAGVDNGLVVACGAAAIDEFTLSTISDLAAAIGVTLGSTSEFQSATVGGLDALNTAYDSSLTSTTVPDVAAAIKDGTVDCGVMPAMTTSIIVDGLIVLQDDKDFAPEDALLALMTAAAGQADVTAVLDAINAKLNTDVIRSLLVKVEVDKQPYDVIAKQFLASVSSEQ